MISRRSLLLPAGPAANDSRPSIHPRADWAGRTRPARERLRPEDEPLFILVHHSETPTPTRRSQVPRAIRGFFDYHTGTKGWADVAYNFLVDPFGGLWEGRTGSLAEAVRGDATGGSQGHAELVCFIGSFDQEPPSDRALDAAAVLLAWLAVRDGIDLSAGRTIHFTSRGSSRWPKGSAVSTWPVAGHREMSHTTCPGDALFPLVRKRLMPAARAILVDKRTPHSPSSATASAPSPTSAVPGPPPSALTEPQPEAPFVLPMGLGVGAAGVAAVGAWYVRRRRQSGGRRRA